MKLFTKIKSIEGESKTRILSCDGEIITFLFENGPARPSQIVLKSRHSHVQVFNKLKELNAIGLVDKLTNSAGRETFYALNNKMLQILQIAIYDKSM